MPTISMRAGAARGAAPRASGGGRGSAASLARLVALSIGEPSEITSSSLRVSVARVAAGRRPSRPPRRRCLRGTGRPSAARRCRGARGASGVSASLKTRWQRSLRRPGCGGPAGAQPVALRAAAVPGAGGEAQDLAGHAGLLERARQHVDQHRDRFDVLLHRARAVDQKAHDAVGHAARRARCGTGAARSARRPAARAGGRRCGLLPGRRPSRRAPGSASSARSSRARRGDVDALRRRCGGRAARGSRPAAPGAHQRRGRVLAVVGGGEDAVAAAGVVEQRGCGPTRRWRSAR